MTMDISNQNKISEFYEELKRLNINIVRPDINKCYADFRFDENNFYYFVVRLLVSIPLEIYLAEIQFEIKFLNLNKKYLRP